MWWQLGAWHTCAGLALWWVALPAVCHSSAGSASMAAAFRTPWREKGNAPSRRALSAYSICLTFSSNLISTGKDSRSHFLSRKAPAAGLLGKGTATLLLHNLVMGADSVSQSCSLSLA